MHDYFMFGSTIALIAAGILFNRQDYKDLRAEIGTIRTDITQLRADMHREFLEFYRTLGQHDAKIENLEKHK